LQARFPGLRPVLFHSPYEAAAWSIISQRRGRNQATALRDRLSAAHGRAFDLDGRTELAFPLPSELLTLTAFPGFEAARVERLRGVATRALEHGLDAARLAAMDHHAAVAEVQTIPGFGPMYATLVALRSTGVSDALTLHEPRFRSYLAHFYDLPGVPDDDEVL